MVLSYEDWKTAKDLAAKASEGVGDVAEAAIVAALAEIPFVGGLLGMAVKKGLDYSAEQIVNMIPHEYPSGIGYVAGDTRALNKLLTDTGHPPLNPASITMEKDREARELNDKAIALKETTKVGPAVAFTPFISAPFGQGPAAAAVPEFHPRQVERRTTRRRKNVMGRKPGSNPFGVGALVPAAIHPRQVSGI